MCGGPTHSKQRKRNEAVIEAAVGGGRGRDAWRDQITAKKEPAIEAYDD